MEKCGKFGKTSWKCWVSIFLNVELSISEQCRVSNLWTLHNQHNLNNAESAHWILSYPALFQKYVQNEYFLNKMLSQYFSKHAKSALVDEYWVSTFLTMPRNHFLKNGELALSENSESALFQNDEPAVF